MVENRLKTSCRRGDELFVLAPMTGQSSLSGSGSRREYKSAERCMDYDDYQGIGLQAATRRTPWCKCNARQ
jgi:hypothetical protein